MLVPAAISQHHELIEPYVKVLSERVRDVVQCYCEREGFAFVGRLKSVESLSEKIETGRFGGWSDLGACCT